MKRRNDYTWLVIAILPLIVYGGGGFYECASNEAVLNKVTGF